MAELDPNSLSEDQTTELKESFNERALKSLCAFANTNGGSVFLPVTDNLEIVNESLSDQERQNIVNRVVDSLGIQPSVISHTWNNRDFIEIKVSSAGSPMHLKGKYYIRIGNTTQRMNPEQLRSRMLEAVPWDTQIIENITLSDLDNSEIKRFVQSGQEVGRISAEIDPNNFSGILKQTRLLREEGFTKAALLLFGNNPQSHFPASVIRIGEFASESNITNDKIVEGHLFRQVRRSEEIIKNHMQHGYKISNQEFTRKEQWTYPLTAIREGIMNAIIHRDYQKQGSQIQIKLFDDHLSIFSPGGLPGQLTIEDLWTVHPSVRRNDLLANMFFRAGLIESFGTGISRIRQSLKEAEMPEPILDDKGYSFVLTFRQHKEEVSKKRVDKTYDLNERQIKALELAKESTIRTSDLSKIFTNVEDRTIRRDLKALVDKNLLEAKGQTSNRYYKLK